VPDDVHVALPVVLVGEIPRGATVLGLWLKNPICNIRQSPICYSLTYQDHLSFLSVMFLSVSIMAAGTPHSGWLASWLKVTPLFLTCRNPDTNLD
jgi:hypothetical protein